ncbi:MAG: HIT family protein [Candidatus Woesearchaeota archaeon]
MNDCIFCKILNGEIPCVKVYEDSEVLAFLDIAPNNKGHTLVITKEHHETMLDTPDELLSKLVVAVKKVGLGVYQATGSKGFNVAQNNYKVAGQLVPHIHFHIIPRNEDDGFEFWPQGKYGEGEMEEWRNKIVEALK